MCKRIGEYALFLDLSIYYLQCRAVTAPSQIAEAMAAPKLWFRREEREEEKGRKSFNCFLNGTEGRRERAAGGETATKAPSLATVTIASQVVSHRNI